MFPRNGNRNEGTFAKTTLLRNRALLSPSEKRIFGESVSSLPPLRFVLQTTKKGQRRNGLSKNTLLDDRSPHDAFSAPLARSDKARSSCSCDWSELEICVRYASSSCSCSSPASCASCLCAGSGISWSANTSVVYTPRQHHWGFAKGWSPKGWLPKGWFWQMFPERGCIPMFACTKTGTRVHLGVSGTF